MELTFAQQSSAFLISLPIGVAAGIAYGLIGIIRKLFSCGRVSGFILDFMFMLAASLALFCFSVAYINGAVRLYLYLGFAIGFVLYRGTLGRLLAPVVQPAAAAAALTMRKIRNKIKNFTKKLLKNISEILYNRTTVRTIFRSKNSDKGIRDNTADEK